MVHVRARYELCEDLAQALTEICRRELTFAAGDAVADHATDRIVAKLLARPMTKLRTAIAHGEALQAFHLTLDSLFSGPMPVPASDRPRGGRRTAPRSR